MNHFCVLVEFGLAFLKDLNLSTSQTKSLQVQTPNISISEHFPILHTAGSHVHITMSHRKARKVIGFLFLLEFS
jgi:hypothetical protein